MILTLISQYYFNVYCSHSSSQISKSKQPRHVIRYIPNLNAVVHKKFTISKLDGLYYGRPFNAVTNKIDMEHTSKPTLCQNVKMQANTMYVSD